MKTIDIILICEAIKEQTKHLMQAQQKHYGYWQLCPKCEGEPVIPTNGLSDTGFRICPVCNGEKKLIRPEINQP